MNKTYKASHFKLLIPTVAMLALNLVLFSCSPKGNLIQSTASTINPGLKDNETATPTHTPTPTPTPQGQEVAQDPPASIPTPNPIAANTSCLNVNPDMLKKLGFNDPFIDCQWHLMHRGQKIVNTLPTSNSFYTGLGISGTDVNAYEAFEQGASGEGVNILITDDSFAKDHPDIAANYNKSLSVGCGNKVGFDTPASVGDHHGVMVSGLAAAVGKNGIGVSGVAYKAKVSGHNVFECGDHDSSYNAPSGVHVWNASWGSSGALKQATSQSTVQMTEAGVARGILYAKSAGNSRACLQFNNYGQCVVSGYSDHNLDDDNSPFIMHVAAMNNQGKFTSYSSPGAGLFVGSYGGFEGNNTPGTITIDRDQNGNYTYTTMMNGTSAASPIAAGVGAVIKSANPNLKPIDIMYLIAKSAIPTNTTRTESSYMGQSLGISNKQFIHWTKNAKGYYHSFDIGFGKINLAGAVNLAKNYGNKNLEIPKKYSVVKNGSAVPASAQGSATVAAKACATKSITINEDYQVFSNEFSFDISGSSSIGQLVIYFKTPSKVVMQLKRINGANLQGTSLAHSQKWKALAAFGENAKGTWEIEVCNAASSGSFEFKEVKMDIYGFTNLNSIEQR